jgi:hypothetical protein
VIKGVESNKLNTKFSRYVRVAVRRLYANLGFPCWRPCLAKRECERKYQDDSTKGDACECGDGGVEISRTGEFQETRCWEEVCERGGGYTTGYLECYAEIARNDRYRRQVGEVWVVGQE